MTYTAHVTKAGDRWDYLAYIYLGDALNITPIIEANPLVPIRPELDENITLYIPIFDPEPLQDFNNLPPWKRPQTS